MALPQRTAASASDLFYVRQDLGQDDDPIFPLDAKLSGEDCNSVPRPDIRTEPAIARRSSAALVFTDRWLV